MKPLDYISSLASGLIEKQRVAALMRTTRSYIDKTLPSYQNAAEFFHESRFASKHANDFQHQFSGDVQSKIRGNFVQVLYGTLMNAEKHYDKILKIVDREFKTDTTKDALTFYKVAVLQHIEAITFLNEYSNRLLLWLYDVETDAVGVTNRLKDVPPAEIKWLAERRGDFFAVVRIFQRTEQEFEKSITAVPDVEATAENQSIINTTQGFNSHDPFSMGFIGKITNPILHLRKMWDEANVREYQESVDYARAMELKLLYLKQARTGEHDGKLEQDIAFIEGEIQRTHQAIQKWEEQYA